MTPSISRSGKPCIRCGITKPMERFSRHPQMADGHLNKCKECCCAYAKQHRVDNSARIKARDAERYQSDPSIRQRHRRYEKTDAGRASVQAARDRWVSKNALKHDAHESLNRAVRSGQILKPYACSICDSIGRIHGHHHDYTKPLLVIWCCASCHKALHAEELV